MTKRVAGFLSKSRLVIPLRPSMEESMEEREEHMGWMQVSVVTAEDDVVSTAQGQNCKHGVQRSEHGRAMTPGAQGFSAGPQPTASGKGHRA